MKKISFLLSIVTLVVVAYSCKKTLNSNLTGASLVLPATAYSYFPNNNPSGVNMGTLNPNFNLDPNQVATLGRVLFYDGHLSVNNAISCGSCHKQALAFADNVPFSSGFEARPTKRNSIAITNVSQNNSFFWDGRENNIANLAMRPLSNHVEMGMEDANALAQKLAALPYYSQLFTNAFGDQQVTSDRISVAIGVFMQAITSNNSRLDQFSNGNTAALTAQEIQGKFLFDTKYPCGSCHNNGGGGSGGYSGGGGTSFLDIGLDASYTDIGRGTITSQATDNGTFKVPNLRNVALTAPYMHDGRYKTLSDVLDHYNSGIICSPNLDTRLMDAPGHAMKMNISDQEKTAIIAFLCTLTDYQMVTDPKFSNPFKAN